MRLADGVNEGIQAMLDEKPDIVIMDIRMPGKSGIEGLKEIRAIDPNVTVVMLTGYGTLETAQQAIRLGANDYVKKPFDTREMTETIREGIQRTRVERRRAHITQELRQLNDELVDELTIKEDMATLGRASAEFVHDLRNPLTVVHGYAQLLIEELQKIEPDLGESSRETFEYLGVIETNIQHCCEMMETWRNLGQNQNKKCKATEVASIIHDVMKGAQPLAADAGASLEYFVEDETCQIMADRIQIFRALQNLVSNALQALPKGEGRVEVKSLVDHKNGMLSIEVVDDGCGMDADQLKQIFQPLYTTKKFEGGSGLGLAITKRVIENYQGTVDVESELGVGTKFRMQFPILKS